MVVDKQLLQLDAPLCMNPPVPYQAQKESLGAQNYRDDHRKNPKFTTIDIAG
jgi:hypothetical protein